MRRADRLFLLVQLLRARRLTTAADLAARLQVSERTVYRDVRDLVASGVPIQGEAGVGYMLPPRFDLPPLMFTAEEVEALVLGARVVDEWADRGLAGAARSALAKIEAVLPDGTAARSDDLPLFSVSFTRSEEIRERLGLLRRAVYDHRKVRFAYRGADGEETVRTVRPLCLTLMMSVWLLTA